MLKVIKRLFINEKFDLDNDGKIESYREEIKGVFAQFTSMSNRLDNVNAKLQEVIEDEKFAQECERDNLERIIKEANKRLAEAEQRIETAHNEIKANEKLQEKVKEFIV